MITHVILEITPILNNAQILISLLNAGTKLTPKDIIELLFLLKDDYNFDNAFWAYLENILPQEVLDALDYITVSQFVELMILDVHSELQTNLGLKTIDGFELVNWTGNAIVLEVPHKHHENTRLCYL
jgi:hypothetical protein